MASFTRSFERAIVKAATLPPEDQDTLAALMLAEIDDARRWDERFTDDRSPTVLKRLAAKALAEDEAGLTEPLEALLVEMEDLAEQPPDTAR
jgi:hypothetical protein